MKDSRYYCSKTKIVIFPGIIKLPTGIRFQGSHHLMKQHLIRRGMGIYCFTWDFDVGTTHWTNGTGAIQRQRNNGSAMAALGISRTGVKEWLALGLSAEERIYKAQAALHLPCKLAVRLSCGLSRVVLRKLQEFG